MIISEYYSHKDGEAFIQDHHPDILTEIQWVVTTIDAESCRLKKPKGKEVKRAERAGVGRFYSPIHLNALFDWYFFSLDWDVKPRIETHDRRRDGYREMDFLKGTVGIEVQIGKYAFLTYDIVAKMVIFGRLGVIDCGVEICPMASMLPHMSSGIGAFEQVVWDLETRGTADIDMPVLLIGFESERIAKQHSGDVQQELPIPSAKPEIKLNRYKGGLTEKTLRKVRETGLDI